MSIPEHKDPLYKNRVARAPYNFVPLPEKIKVVAQPPAHDQYRADLLTGKFSCTLTTASPMYVRAAQTWQEYIHKDKNGKPAPITPSHPFYGDTKETLLIPGSSLRGMLRTLIEVVSWSRIKSVTDKPLFYRTVDNTSIGMTYRKRMAGEVEGEGWYVAAHAGYMELQNGSYYIRPARKIMGVQHFKIEEELARQTISDLKNMSWQRNNGKWSPEKAYRWKRYKIWFKPTAPVSHKPASYTYFAEVTEISSGDSSSPGKGWVRGWLIASGWVPSRKGQGKHRHWIVGPPDNDADLIPVSDDDVELYNEMGGGLSRDIVKFRMSVLPTRAGEQIPCFYTFWRDTQGKQHLAFGHTGMFRLPYEHTPADLIPATLQGDGTQYDVAEAMFGFVDQESEGKREELAGRIFVEDGFLQGNAKTALMEEVVLSDQALSSPKPTTFQHYLTQDAPDDKENLNHYDSGNTTLRGHKFYWHVGDEQTQQRLATAPRPREGGRDQGNRFKPIKAGQTFTFDIHFENLHPEELGALLWVLDKAGDPQYRLKLGMGKPYGLGSVAITYTARFTDRSKRYTELFAGNTWNEGWTGANDGAKKLDQARRAFNRFITGDENTEIDALPRIKELLTLLRWEETPDQHKQEMTRYMRLEEFAGRGDRRNAREQKNPHGLTKRPVLPHPSKVDDSAWYQQLPSRAPELSHGNATQNFPSRRRPELHPDLRKVTSSPRRKRPPKPPSPKPVQKKPSELTEGDIIQAIVYDAPAKGDVFLVPEIHGDEDIVVIPAKYRSFQRYKVDQKILVQVLRTEGDDENGWYIEAEPIWT